MTDEAVKHTLVFWTGNDHRSVILETAMSTANCFASNAQLGKLHHPQATWN